MPDILVPALLGMSTTVEIGLSGTSFKIKVQSVVERYSTRYRDNTGDGDTKPTYSTNGYLYGAISLVGVAIAGTGNTVGINALKAGTRVSATIIFNTGYTITGTLFVHALERRARRGATEVPLALSCLLEAATVTEAAA